MTPQQPALEKAILTLLKGQDVPLTTMEIAHQITTYYEGDVLVCLEFTNVELLVALNRLWLDQKIRTAVRRGVSAWVIGEKDEDRSR